MTRTMPSREWFAHAGEGFVEQVRGVGAADLDRPGLGEWTVRELIGHTNRAFTTVVDYVGVGAPDPESGALLRDAGAYFAAAAGGKIDHAAVAERGRVAGRALGDDPVRVVVDAQRRANLVVAENTDAKLVGTPFGPMRLVDYLETRAFELTVHGLDLAYALRRGVPAGTRTSVPQALRLLADIAGPDAASAAVRALTGRAALPAGFSLL
ncbi:maleylpyruvate isomerase N-terminal domain-containing protein [Ammonicoccus fulvus]|uniref:Maleylpyruvate isomerase N-terminal domain-containing protein n=1 Tax=Ammonicoccus fulvus TaxID=3138240 RepID=A0ABZ3FSB2_9ACTN